MHFTIYFLDVLFQFLDIIHFANEALNYGDILLNPQVRTTHDLLQAFAYNPASQIASVTRSNDAYAWQAHYNVDRAYTIDGLNRIMSAGGIGFSYDGRGNLTSDGTNSFSYTSENLLKTGPASATLGYDPLRRLYRARGRR